MMRRVLQQLEREAQRLARRKNALALAVAVTNTLSIWRMLELDADGRAKIEPAMFVLAVCSALAMAIALHARQRLRDIERQIRMLREGRLFDREH